MPAPPMNDSVVLSYPAMDESGQPLEDDYGRPAGKEKLVSKARVAYTAEVVFDRTGNEVDAKLEIDLPSSTPVQTGYEVEWIDRFGVKVNGPIERITEVLSYSGKQVYFRKVFVT